LFLSKTFSAFKHPDFRLIWIGAFISNVGTWMQKVAQPWVILQISGSPFLLGLDGFLQDAPLLFLLLIGGVLVDRLDKRKILIASQLLQLLGATLITILIVVDRLEVWMILAVSFVIGCMQAISTPAYLALIPTLVPRTELQNAIALNSTQFNLSRLIGPVIAGLLLTTLGAAWCFGLNALSFLAPILSLSLIAVSTKASTLDSVPGTMLKSIKAGMKEVFARRELVAIITIVFGVSFFAGPILIFIPVVATEVLNVGAQGFSLALSMFGAGAVVGALRVASLEQKQIRLKTVFRATLLLSIMVSGVGLSQYYGLSLLLLLGTGFLFVSCNSVCNTIMQQSISDEYRGRAMSIFAMSFRGGLPLGALLTGFMVQYTNVRLALALNGLGLLAVLLFSYLRVRRPV
jgi:MFS family permease